MQRVSDHDGSPATEPGGSGSRSRLLLDRLCAAVAAGDDQDPIGTGGTVDRLLAIEIPTPWTRPGVEPDPSGTIPQRVMAEQRDFKTSRPRNPAKVPANGSTPVLGIAPDPEWSDPRVRRVLSVARPTVPFARYQVDEYHFPVDSPEVVDLVSTFLRHPEEIPRFDHHRIGATDGVDLLVCTHGSRDICCAKFGMPLYRQARAAFPAVRAWRTMHFGGHRYAPTAWEFPAGYKWGFLDEAAAAVLLERGDPASLARKLRGWSGVPAAVQPLDRIGLLDHGWAWLDFLRSGTVAAGNDAAASRSVRLDFRAPDGTVGAYEGITRVGRRLPAAGCGPAWGDRDELVEELELAVWSRVPARDRP